MAPEWIGLLQLSPAQAFAVCHIKRERQHQHQHQRRKPPNLFSKIYYHQFHWPAFFKSKISQGLRHIENPQNCSPCLQPYFLNEGLVRGGGGGRQTSFCPNSDYIAMSKPLFGSKQPNGLICRPGPPSHTKTFVCLYHPAKTTSLQGVVLW